MVLLHSVCFFILYFVISNCCILYPEFLIYQKKNKQKEITAQKENKSWFRLRASQSGKILITDYLPHQHWNWWGPLWALNHIHWMLDAEWNNL